MTPQWVMHQDFLHLQSQARKAAPHIGMARRQPHPHASGDWNHRSAFNTADTSKGGADPQILIRPLPVNSTTITSPDGTASSIGSAFIAALLPTLWTAFFTAGGGALRLRLVADLIILSACHARLDPAFKLACGRPAAIYVPSLPSRSCCAWRMLRACPTDLHHGWIATRPSLHLSRST